MEKNSLTKVIAFLTMSELVQALPNQVFSIKPQHLKLKVTIGLKLLGQAFSIATYFHLVRVALSDKWI